MADNKCKKLKNCSKRHIRRIENEFCRRFDNKHYSDTTSEDDIIRALEIRSTEIVYASTYCTSSNLEPKLNNESNVQHLPLISLSNNNSAQHDENEYYSNYSNNSSYCSSPISSSCNSNDGSNIDLAEIDNVDSLIENNIDDNIDDCSNLEMNCSLLEVQLREWHFNHNTTLP